MKKGYLSQYFKKVAVKLLGAVETDSSVSHQHEFNGVKGIKAMLGEPTEKLRLDATFLYLTDDDDDPVTEDGYLTWYDARKDHPKRTEWRLYYSPNTPMQKAEEGDILFIAQSRNSNRLLVIVAEKESTICSQLQWLFGVSGQVNPDFSVRADLETENDRLSFAANYILEQIGIESDECNDSFLEQMLHRFDGEFPPTAIFSAYARETLPEINCLDSPDSALTAWMEREEVLYRTLEKHILGISLKQLVLESQDDIETESFVQLVHGTLQRRKARAGSALENHLEEIFQKFKIPYTRNGITEQRHKPDFIFPGISQYHDKNFPSDKLSMLGAKSTCKDRWRQILTEADRIPKKHLITLEPSISENQTREMQQENVSLVVPQVIQSTYSNYQRKWLRTVKQFIESVS